LKPLAIKRPKVDKNEFNVINPKPEYCGQCCRLANESYGYVRDWYGKEPRVAIMGVVPASRELAQGAWASEWFVEFLNTFFTPVGLTKENLILTYVLRCSPKYKEPKDEHPYPRATLRKHAERSCRFHDIALTDWKPNAFIATHDVYNIRKLSANKVLFKHDLEKAVRLANRGLRPLLLMGEEPLHLVAPGLTLGPKTWRGHWWEGAWQWTAGEAQVMEDKPVAPKWRLNVTKAVAKPRGIKQLELF